MWLSEQQDSEETLNKNFCSCARKNLALQQVLVVYKIILDLQIRTRKNRPRLCLQNSFVMHYNYNCPQNDNYFFISRLDCFNEKLKILHIENSLWIQDEIAAVQ